MTTAMRQNRRTRAQLKRLIRLTEAQTVAGWTVILFLGALLGTIYLRQTSRIATTGRQVQILQNKLTDLKRENAALEQQIAEAQSIDRLESEAARLGFVPARPGDIEYLVIPNYPASTAVATATPASPETAVPPPITIREALWLTFKSSVNSLIQGEANEN